MINAYPGYNMRCQAVNYSTSYTAIYELHFNYAYFLVKISDFIETIFFILRKKNSQVSFLHVYHNVMMAFIAYTTVKFAPGGHGLLLAIVNSYVHVIMYVYYLLASLKYDTTSWKKHITHVQFVQFVILLFHFGRPIFLGNYCKYPSFLHWYGFLQSLVMIYLFGKFYIRSYPKMKKK